MSAVKLNLGQLKQELKLNVDGDISGMHVLEVVPDASGQRKFGLVIANADGSNRQETQIGYKLVEEGAIEKNPDNGVLTIADGYEIRTINEDKVVVKRGSNQRASKFTFTK